MLLKQQILLNIKQQIREVVPGATVILFGSRVTDRFTEESDWDILVLSPQKSISSALKQSVHNKVFPLSVSIGAFINILLVSNSDWQNNPSYYSLKRSIAENNLVL